MKQNNLKHLTFPELINLIIETAGQYGASSAKLAPMKVEAHRKIAMFDTVQQRLRGLETIFQAQADKARALLKDQQ